MFSIVEVHSSVLPHDVGRQSIILHRLYVPLWHELTASLYQPPAQNQHSRVRPIPSQRPSSQQLSRRVLSIDAFVSPPRLPYTFGKEGRNGSKVHPATYFLKWLKKRIAHYQYASRQFCHTQKFHYARHRCRSLNRSHRGMDRSRVVLSKHRQMGENRRNSRKSRSQESPMT